MFCFNGRVRVRVRDRGREIGAGIYIESVLRLEHAMALTISSSEGLLYMTGLYTSDRASGTVMT